MPNAASPPDSAVSQTRQRPGPGHQPVAEEHAPPEEVHAERCPHCGGRALTPTGAVEEHVEVRRYRRHVYGCARCQQDLPWPWRAGAARSPCRSAGSALRRLRPRLSRRDRWKDLHLLWIWFRSLDVQMGGRFGCGDRFRRYATREGNGATRILPANGARTSARGDYCWSSRGNLAPFPAPSQPFAG